MQAIRKELSKQSVRDWLGTNVVLNIRKLSATRDWRNHIPSLGVKLEGGLLRDDTGNHMFLSLLRKGTELSNSFPSRVVFMNLVSNNLKHHGLASGPTLKPCRCTRGVGKEHQHWELPWNGFPARCNLLHKATPV